MGIISGNCRECSPVKTNEEHLFKPPSARIIMPRERGRPIDTTKVIF